MNPFPVAARTEMIDAFIEANVSDASFERQLWTRVSAKERTFTKVSFKYMIFTNCYLRKCRFVECDFTGAIFTDTSLRGSTFDASHFDYCRFYRTLLGHDVIEKNLPGYENVQVELARNLRSNFAQIGDTDGVNKAISVELAATRIHYYKAAWSKEAYYRGAIKGGARLEAIWKHFHFVLLHFLWGNGESPARVGAALLLAIAALGVVVWFTGASPREAATSAAPLFFGVRLKSPSLPNWLLTTAAAARLVAIALFTSVLVRRWARR